MGRKNRGYMIPRSYALITLLNKVLRDFHFLTFAIYPSFAPHFMLDKAVCIKL